MRLVTRLLLVALGAAASGGPAWAAEIALPTNQWVEQTPTVQPLPGFQPNYRDDSWTSMIYSQRLGRVVLKNGFDGGSPNCGGSHSDTIYANTVWSYDVASDVIRMEKVSNWEGNPATACPENSSDPTPIPRHPYAMWVEIPELDRIDLFNGANSGSPGGHPNDHWSWSPTTKRWTERVNRANTPWAVAHEGCSAYDTDAKRVVYYLGEQSQTWLYNPTTNGWSQVSGGGTPGAKMGCRMQWDPVRKRVYMFGGGSYPNGDNELWEWSTTTARWTLKTPSGQAPATRKMHCFAYDSRHDVFLIAGGQAAEGGTSRSDTWLYVPSTNAYQQLSPSAGYGGLGQVGCAYDPVENVFVMTGRSDWWLYRYSDTGTPPVIPDPPTAVRVR